MQSLRKRFPGGMWGFLKALKQEWTDDRASYTAAALTFYGVLAIFPFLLFLISLSALLIDPTTAEALIDELSRVAPPAVTEILGTRIRALAEGESPGLVTFSALFAIWAASSGVVALIAAFNQVYDVKEERPYWKVRGLAILTVLGAAVLAIGAAVLMVLLPVLLSPLPDYLETAFFWLRIPVAGLLIMLLWSLLYYILPDVEQKFRFVTPGSVMGVIVWLLASWGFSYYVRNFGNYDATYGALGGVIIFLLWIWISAQVLLLGAEVNALWEARAPRGKRPGEKRAGGKGVAALPKAQEGAARAEVARPLAPEAPAGAPQVGGAPGRAAPVTAPPAQRRGGLWKNLALSIAALLLGKRIKRRQA